MPTAAEEFKREIVLSYHLNWNYDRASYRFDLRKAYICSLLSECAYDYDQLPDQGKLIGINRGFIQPGGNTQIGVISDISTQYLNELLIEGDFETAAIAIRRPKIVILIYQINDLIFIALRGTQKFIDWLIDLYAVPKRTQHGYFHRGFYQTIVNCFKEIEDELVQCRRLEGSAIYITGHSLGGAMAAIMNAIWKMKRDNFILKSHSCYTFGMPRYGNRKAVAKHRRPHHFFNALDLVPFAPSRLLGFGFANCPKRRESGYYMGLQPDAREDYFLHRLFSLIPLRLSLEEYGPCKAHSIRGYSELLQDLCRSAR